jgi:hypothetical protein
VQLDWFIKGQLLRGLPVIHEPKTPLGIIHKESGISPVIVPGFQFWPKSETLGLGGTQPT